MLVSGPRGRVNKQVKLLEYLSTCKFKWCLLFVALFCFFLCVGEFGLGEFNFRGRPAGPEAREKGRILAEA
jgi:hypothetical protein